MTTALRKYFNVSHSFVLRKILLLLFPFRGLSGCGSGAVQPHTSMWAADQSPGSQQQCQAPPVRMELTNAEGLKVDVEDPDLYVPLMAYVSYVLLYGTTKGTVGEFHPEMLSSTATFAAVLLFLEVGLAKLGFYLASATNISALDLGGIVGYKYVNLALMVAAKMLLGSGYAYHVVFFYSAACAGCGVYRFLRHLGPPVQPQQGFGQPSSGSMFFTQVVIALTIAQLPLCWLMTPSVGGLSSGTGAGAAVDLPGAPKGGDGNAPRRG